MEKTLKRDEVKTPNNQEGHIPEHRSHMPSVESTAERPPGYKIDAKEKLRTKDGPPMIVSIVDRQLNPGTQKWEYHLRDSDGKDVNTRGTDGVEWIAESRLV
ncbi:MAG: hypothetical protein Q9160_006757 [Pyrenula sp. 1 TL-2023]